jgi:hypothetical protein
MTFFIIDSLRHDIGLVLLRLGTFLLDLRERVRIRDNKSLEFQTYCRGLADLNPGEVIEESNLPGKAHYLYIPSCTRIRNRSNTSSYI